MKRILLLAAAALVISTAACSAQGDGTVGVGPDDGERTVESLQTTDDLVAQGLLAGNAKPSFGAGDPGKIAVVAMGPIPFLGDMEIVETPIVVRNNTDAPVRVDSLKIEGRDSTGESLEHKIGWWISPVVLQPGGLGLGKVAVRGKDIGGREGVTFDFVDAPTTTNSRGTPTDITIDSITNNGESFVGQVTNTSEFSWTTLNTVQITCFDAEGAPVASIDGMANTIGEILNGESESFDIRQRAETCPVFLASGQAYGGNSDLTR